MPGSARSARREPASEYRAAAPTRRRRLNNNTLEDPDGNEYPSNVIHGTLQCLGNSPEAQFGDAGGEENKVTGPRTGQCAKLK